jgi:hypothetical protein
MMNQSLENLFDKAVTEQIGDFANAVLYELCSTHFDHKEAKVVLAKIWLIGRSYAAAIERRRWNLEIPNDEFYVMMSDWLVTSDLGEGLQRLKSTASEQSISDDNSLNILTIHKRLVDLARDKTGLYKRSFASKYLHFHLPGLFFIYDSRAARSLPKIAKELPIRISDEDKKLPCRKASMPHTPNSS